MIIQSNFLQTLGWAILNSLWQMALLWMIYQFITGSFKSVSSAKKSSLATTLLIAGFAWFVFTFVSIFTTNSPSDTSVAGNFTRIAGNEQLNTWLKNTLPVASLVYLLLLVLPVLHFIKNYRYVKVIRSYGLGKMEAGWRLFVQKVASQMGIKKPVSIWVSELVSSPVTIGYLKPIILVPLAAISHLTPRQLEAVLLHELSHIRRYDYLINLIINGIRAVLYFNPFVNAFVKIVEREREKSCDEMVMQFQYDPHAYATALLMLEKENHASKPLAVAAAGKKNDLLHRIEVIMGVHKKPFLSFNKLAGLFAGLLCIIVLNALLIMSKPLKGNKAANFANISSPLYFFTGDDTYKNPAPSPEIKSASYTIENKVKEKKDLSIAPADLPEPVETPESRPELKNVNFINAAVEAALSPQLRKYEQEHVKQALEASKRVLEEAQWKTAEKNLADVFTEKEKEYLKKVYLKEAEKFDWNKWENKLKTAYNQIDWEKINVQLEKAITNIKLDSLQKVYNIAASKLDKVQAELIQSDLKGIPDTDITLKELEQKKEELRKLSGNLKAIRSKKIVRL